MSRKKDKRLAWLDDDFHRTMKINASKEDMSMLEYQRRLNIELKNNQIKINVKRKKNDFEAFINF
jgi:hypothetical protein